MALHMDPLDPKGGDKNKVNLPIHQAQEQHQRVSLECCPFFIGPSNLRKKGQHSRLTRAR